MKFQKAQKNYIVSKKEMLGVLEFLKNFRNIVFGAKVILNTDYANLIFNPGLMTSRTQRWKLLLEEYNIEVKYKKSKCNVVTDFFSQKCFAAVPLQVNLITTDQI